MDYDKGDVVVCIRVGPNGSRFFRLGALYVVREVWKRNTPCPFEPGTLWAEDTVSIVGVSDLPEAWCPDCYGWDATAFKKWTPPVPDLIAKHTERPKVVTE